MCSKNFLLTFITPRFFMNNTYSMYSMCSYVPINHCSSCNIRTKLLGYKQSLMYNNYTRVQNLTRT